LKTETRLKGIETPPFWRAAENAQLANFENRDPLKGDRNSLERRASKSCLVIFENRDPLKGDRNSRFRVD